jgi:hypothetical protein|tara:strand:+ start:1807 stop:2502 length:696 start_codon:yes stop_codon:yes gene_type:complete
VIENRDIQVGAVTLTKLSKNLRIPFSNIVKGTAGQIPVVQADGDLGFVNVSGDGTLDEAGSLTVNLGATSTDDMPEGGNNLYYTDARVDERIRKIKNEADQQATSEEPGFMPKEDKQKLDRVDETPTTSGIITVKEFYVKWDNVSASTPGGDVSFSGTDVTMVHNLGTPFVLTSVMDITGHLGGGANSYADVNASSDVVVHYVSDNETKLSFNSEPDADDDFKVTILGRTG